MKESEGSFWVDEENKELVLKDNGEEERFYIEDELNVKGSKYLVLIAAEATNSEEEETNEALVLKLAQEDGGEVLKIIEDDEEFEEVKQAYLEK